MANELTWHDMLVEKKQQPYFLNTLQTVASERQPGIIICPPQKDIFNAFRFTGLDNVKVVTLGQDPYHEPGQAHGLASSARPDIVVPPPLLNMYKELENTIPGFTRPNHGYLKGWARQDVPLLDTVLTVRAGQAHSHAGLDWEMLTDKVVSLINQHREGVMFLLWGSYAQEKGAVIDKQRHHVLRAPHPPPFSAYRGFFGYNHFVLINQWLGQRGKTPIDWMPVSPAESE